jgi:pimeloyl-ACP methyl ester carboxylesterase
MTLDRRCLSILSLTIAVLVFALPVRAAPSLALQDCRIEGTPALTSFAARCGKLSVAEDPARPSGPRIDLSVAVVPAISTKARPDPLFLIAGGPGQGTQEFYASVAGAFAGLRRERDIVLLDQRGTGHSHRLGCKMPGELWEQQADPAQFEALAKKCLGELPGQPRFYTTSVAVRDLDTVRAALGYERINIYGISYGTRVAQHYARRYPGRLRTVILDGVVDPTLALGPTMALDAERAVNVTFERCRKDPACDKAWPDAPAQFAALRRKLSTAKVPVRITHPVTGKPEQVDLGPDHLAAVARLLAYSPRGASLLPLVVHEANTNGNYLPLAAQAATIADQTEDLLALGMHNTVVCSEDLPYVDAGSLDRAALAQTFMGTKLFDGLQAMCRAWPRGPVDADLKLPLSSRVPALLLSGELDPVTPPAWAARAARGFSDQRHVVVAGQGHGQLGSGCVQGIMRRFLDAGTARGLDVGCAAKIQPAPLFTSFGGPEP